MTETLQAAPHTALANEFARFEGSRPAGEPGALRDLRKKAIDCFTELGFPTTQLEEWRLYQRVEDRRPRLVPGGEPRRRSRRPTSRSDFLANGSRLVFIDGRFSPELSHLAGLPDGVMVDSLGHALETAPERVLPHLGQHVGFEDQGNAFAALNTALFTDGAFVDLPRGAVVERRSSFSIHRRETAQASRDELPAHPGGRGRDEPGVTLVESLRRPAERRTLTCAVTELVPPTAPCSATSSTTSAEGKSGARSTWRATSMPPGAGANVYSNARLEFSAAPWCATTSARVSTAKGRSARLNGLYVLKGTQHTRQPHARRPRQAELRQLRALQGHSRRQLPRRLQRPRSTYAPGRPEDRRQAVEPQPAAVREGAGQQQSAARDLRRRRQVHGTDRPWVSSTRTAVFYLRSRGIGKEAGQEPFDLRLRRRHRRAHQVRRSAQRARRVPLRAAPAIGEVVRQTV